MRRILLLVLVTTMMACRPTRTVKIAWDAPASPPDGYRILVDGRVVLDIPPPPVDPGCHCLTIAVPVPRGQHTLSVVAYNRGGSSQPSAAVVVQ
jgi:hypothetical protein